MNSNGQKRGSAGETILWMIITAATVFVVTSFQHTKMTLGNDQYVASEAKFQKLEKAKELIFSGKYSLTEIAEKLGYSSIYAFSKAFKKQYGNPPSSFKQTANNR